MTEQPERIQLVKGWVKKAENDLVTAKHTLTLGEDCPRDTVGFHAQQCVEKYIKALLTYYETAFGKTHDIGELALLLPGSVDLELTEQEQDLLTDFATVSRYPGDWEEPSKAEVDYALKAADRVRHTARTLMKEVL